MMRLTALTLACAAAVSGCAGVPKVEKMKAAVNADMATEIAAVKAEQPQSAYGLKRVARESLVPGAAYTVSSVGDDEDRGTTTLRANGALSSIVAGLAKSANFSLSWTDEVDRNKPVSLSVSNVSEIAAIRKAAAAAGYVAAFDRESRTVTIAKQAVYTFKLPIQVMQQLDTTFSVGGNPLSTGGSGGGAGGAAGGGGGSSLQASFNVNGKVSSNGTSWVEYLSDLAGSNASVSASIEAGYVSVRGNGVALERVRSFLQKFSDNAMRRIEIQASVIDIKLGDEFQYGVDWNKLLNTSARGLSGAFNVGVAGGAATVANPSLSIAYTSATVASIINLLQTKTNVKVVTQPSITTMNRTPAVIFDGVQLPYLGEISTVSQQTSTETSGAVSFVVDGVTLSILPEIMSDTEAQITILPVISSVREFKSFSFGGTNQLVAPVQLSKQALMTAISENGKTVIMGGIRYNSDSATSTLIPATGVPLGMNNNTEAREVAILLRANVVPGKRQNILFAESI